MHNLQIKKLRSKEIVLLGPNGLNLSAGRSPPWLLHCTGVHHDSYTVLAHQEVGSLRREVLWNARECSSWYKDLSKLPCRLVLQILLAFLPYIPSPLQAKLCLSLPQILQPLVFGPALNLRFVHASDYHSGLLTGLSISSSLFSNLTSVTNPFNKNLTAISSISSRLPQPPKLQHA